mgnify:CR=1 FL=1
MKTKADFEKIRRLSADIRIYTLKGLAASVGFGHIGGAMSIADVLAVLYGGMMKVHPDDPKWEDRDYLVLSKGHCGPALYAALALKGYYPISWLETINGPETRLPSHADGRKTPGVDISTGSLGQGMSTAAGIALGNAMNGKKNYTYCIIGDGECQEGQVWEGIMFSVHQKLDHLIIFVDDNKKQLDGPVKEIQNPLSFEEKFKTFGCHVKKVCGYDCEEIWEATEEAKHVRGCPSVIILDTEKGIGCNFAEKESFNHYMTFDVKMAEGACEEIERRLRDNTYPRGEQND